MGGMCRVLLIHRTLTYTNRNCLRKKREGKKRGNNGRQEWERDGDDSCEIAKRKKKHPANLRWSEEQTTK